MSSRKETAARRASADTAHSAARTSHTTFELQMPTIPTMPGPSKVTNRHSSSWPTRKADPKVAKEFEDATASTNPHAAPSEQPIVGLNHGVSSATEASKVSSPRTVSLDASDGESSPPKDGDQADTKLEGTEPTKPKSWLGFAGINRVVMGTLKLIKSSEQSMSQSHQDLIKHHQGMVEGHESMLESHQRMLRLHEGMFEHYQSLVERHRQSEDQIDVLIGQLRDLDEGRTPKKASSKGN